MLTSQHYGSTGTFHGSNLPRQFFYRWADRAGHPATTEGPPPAEAAGRHFWSWPPSLGLLRRCNWSGCSLVTWSVAGSLPPPPGVIEEPQLMAGPKVQLLGVPWSDSPDRPKSSVIGWLATLLLLAGGGGHRTTGLACPRCHLSGSKRVGTILGRSGTRAGRPLCPVCGRAPSLCLPSHGHLANCRKYLDSSDNRCGHVV